ncbi:MAG: PIG-L family deacetylase [Kiritimatiellae bacterium]|nr:PIG-L family deacetylase [Kiritimatiellia bacterium]
MKATALVLAPHPDDESITGLLALRLQVECGFRIVVVPATLGSRRDRRAARRRELRAACACLGFRVRFPKSLASGPAQISELRGILESIRPAVVLLPHARDGHPTHRETHRRGLAALDAAARQWAVVETEFWHPLERPNLMVAARPAHLAKLRRALACHRGELERHDYAVRLAAWMSDNVRRGAELVGQRGAPAPAMAYATLYRARIRGRGRWQPAYRGGRMVVSPADLADLAQIWRVEAPQSTDLKPKGCPGFNET